MHRCLTACQQYGLLSNEVKAVASLEGEMTILDQNSKRMHKVQRFKREREIKSQLAANQMKRMRLHQLQAEVNIQTKFWPCTIQLLFEHPCTSLLNFGLEYSKRRPLLVS